MRWARRPSRQSPTVGLQGFLTAMVLAGSVWILQTAPSAAHLWHEAAADLDPAQIEAVVSALEQAAADAGNEGWRPNPEIVANSASAAYALLRRLGRSGSLPPESERMLVTYDALRLNVVDARGAFAPDADVFLWFETLRAADAPAMAPFRARLDAWRARLTGTE